MKVTKNMMEVLSEMEWLIGSNCYNPDAIWTNGYIRVKGNTFHYPFNVPSEKQANTYIKHSHMKMINAGVTPQNIKKVYYAFGANHIEIGKAVIAQMEMLEERYGLDFNALEKEYKKKNHKR